MMYMRDTKNIQINGSTQKKKLRYMGYFHGYKGYRYFSSPNSLLQYSTFNELQAVYDFDMRIKTILYPQIMFLETAMKNYVLEIILDSINSERFTDVYSKLLNDYKSHNLNSNKYKEAFKKRLSLRNKIYSLISRDYEKSNIVRHYYDKDEPLPIWAIFELMSFGEFGNFIACLNISTRKKISESIGIKPSFDTDGRMPEKIIYALKDLRNAIAHNNAIFDVRFRSGNIIKRIPNYIKSETNIEDLNFKVIVDYVILVSFVMKLLKCNKSDIMYFIKQFEEACEIFINKVPKEMYFKIIHTNTKNKLKKIKNFL